MAETEKKLTGALARLNERAKKSVQQEAPTVHIALDLIDFDPNQPRIAFHAPDGLVTQSDEEALRELAQSIKVNGLIHPITVSEKPDGRYLVRVGERRTRASKLLMTETGKTTIEARVRNDLTGMSALALQMAENTDRQNLTDLEIAQTIKRFITKSEENPKPMTRKEVAAAIGKSAGYITRYLAFVDDALRTKWVVPGYVDTVEVLYQVSVLPEAIQELAYAELSTGRMESPLSWKGLQYYKNLAKAPVAPKPGEQGGSGAGTASAVPMAPVAQVDAIAAALAAAGPDGVVNGVGDGSPVIPMGGSPEGAVPGSAPATDGYALPPEVQASLQVPTYTPPAGTPNGGASPVRSTPAVMPNTAVPCRMPVSVLKNLIAKFGEKVPEMSKMVAEVRFSSDVAVDLVRELTGETVPEDTVVLKLAQALEMLKD